MTAVLATAEAALHEMAPLLRRAVALDPGTLVRVRTGPKQLSALLRLPFHVLAGRTVEFHPTDRDATEPIDRTVTAADLLAWLDGERAGEPDARDTSWRGTLPPATGWQRVDTIPDDVIRGLVRAGASALSEAAAREGVPGAQPRAELADALLDSVVLRVHNEAGTVAEVRLRPLSALTRLGFLRRDSHAAVDVRGRWTRLAAAYGSVYAESAGSGLDAVPIR